MNNIKYYKTVFKTLVVLLFTFVLATYNVSVSAYDLNNINSDNKMGIINVDSTTRGYVKPTKKYDLSDGTLSIYGVITKEIAYSAKKFNTSTGRIKFEYHNITDDADDLNMTLYVYRDDLFFDSVVKSYTLGLNQVGNITISGLDSTKYYYFMWDRPQFSSETTISGSIKEVD